MSEPKKFLTHKYKTSVHFGNSRSTQSTTCVEVGKMVSSYRDWKDFIHRERGELLMLMTCEEDGYGVWLYMRCGICLLVID